MDFIPHLTGQAEGDIQYVLVDRNILWTLALSFILEGFGIAKTILKFIVDDFVSLKNNYIDFHKFTISTLIFWSFEFDGS